MRGTSTESKLTIYSNKPLDQRKGNSVRAIVTDETLAELHELSDRTGIKIQQLTRMLIEYGLEHVEVIE